MRYLLYIPTSQHCIFFYSGYIIDLDIFLIKCSGEYTNNVTYLIQQICSGCGWSGFKLRNKLPDIVYPEEFTVVDTGDTNEKRTR